MTSWQVRCCCGELWSRFPRGIQALPTNSAGRSTVRDIRTPAVRSLHCPYNSLRIWTRRLTERPDGPGWAVYRFGTSTRARDGRLLIAFYCLRGIFVVDREWSTTQLDTTGRHLPTYAAIHSISAAIASKIRPPAGSSVFEAGPIKANSITLSGSNQLRTNFEPPSNQIA